MAEEELDYVIEQVDQADNSPTVLARIGCWFMARAAFVEGIKRRPGERLLMRQKARICGKSWEPD